MNPKKKIPDSMPETGQPEAILKKIFGFESFRPLQKEIIGNILQKKHTLAIMPTGGGKSLCYQIPALIFDGLTIVVSPLISLMKDQVDQLTAYGVSAACLNSSLPPQDYREIMQRVRQNDIDLLYLAPETLLKDSILQLLSGLKVDCFAIDEAHCISEWGHDFRPEYRKLAEVKNKFDDAVCLALTATATPQVQEDIAGSLGLDDANTFVASFNRKNLYLDVVNKTAPLHQIINFLKHRKDESGIIYCFSRRQVDELTQDLEANGLSALPYHAGLGEAERVQNQDAFIRDEVNIIVATIAFGMGIDKPDVRFIIHHDMPKNIESYYQQIGRAGRDGLQSDCLFLFSYGDVGKIRYFINQKTDEEKAISNQHLEDLLGFVEARQCRRILLLNYFGEKFTEENCGMCDYCTGEIPDKENLTVPAQKFLSTVARTDQRFGFHHIKNILMGSKRKKILQLRHNQLSTYGIGNEFSSKQWKQLYRELMRQFVITKDADHGSIKLTPKALSILKGEKEITGIIDEEERADPVKATKSDIESLDYDQQLFGLLKECRMELARKDDVPPYVIFADTTLIEMAYYLPQSEKNLLKTHGVGSAKNQKYGGAFLEVIIDYCTQNNLQEKSKTQKRSMPKPPISRSKRHHQTGDEFNSGKSIPEIAALFGVKESTVIGHITKYIKEGHAVRKEGIRELSSLNDDNYKKVENAFQEIGVELLRPVYDAFDEQISYNELRIVQLYMMAEEQA
ncbi:MAG: DNA helicase RecQ [Balneolaceae bacterium]